MKIKNLLLTLGLAVIAGIGWYVVNDEGQEAAAYIPRSDYNAVETGAKGAFEYYQMIKANVYTGQVESEDILTMQKSLKKVKMAQAKNDDIEWESMGPNNVGGRTRAILPLSDGTNSIMAGAVSGGLFRSNNSGLSWNLIESFDPYLIVSSLAQLGNGAIYCATGNSREPANGQGNSGFIGRGLFVSNDDGVTWDLVSDFEPQPYTTSSNWANIDVIKADPVNPDKLWIGSNLGFYGYIHGSETLEDNKLFTVNISNDTVPVTNNVKDFDISQDGQRFLVVSAGRVFTSTDGGATFNHINCGSCFSGLPSSFGTAEVAISRNNSDIMYLSVALPNGYLQGVYATVNGGSTWSTIAPQSNVNGTLSQFTPFYNGATAQGWYDHMLTSIPSDDSEQIIMGGIRMWRWELTGSAPGITAWEEVNANFTSGPGQPPSPIYVHSDIHTDSWDAQGRLYTGTDGGVYRSDNDGATWTELAQDYTTTQYYAIAFNPLGQVLGGTQDNSSLWLDLEGANPKFATALIGGDGVGCEISQYFPDYMFMSQQRGTIFRSTDRGESVALMQGLVGPGEDSNDFTTDMALHENPNNELSEIFVEYSPAVDSPWLVYYDTDTVTPAGDTIIARIPAGAEIQIDADNNDYILPYTVEEDINFYSYYQRLDPDSNILEFNDIADTAFIQEKPQFMFAAGYSQGTFVTRQPYKTNGVPQFFQVDNQGQTEVTSMEWSPDGDHLYIGYRSGQLVRISNFNSAWTPQELAATSPDYVLERAVIHSGSGAVTDIEVDYSQGRGEDASERVAISIGGYQGLGKIRVSDQAASIAGIGTFEDVWNVPSEFIGMPAYSVVMDIDDPQLLIAGTEYGIWYSGNNGETWSEANNGEMVRVPVFDLRQQKREPWNVSNHGVVYAGTHGRGVFKTNYLLTPTSVEDITDEVPVLNALKVFPNPVTSRASISFDLGTTADIELYIYSIDGRLIEAFQEQRVGAGVNRQIDFDASDFSIGQYIVQLRVGDDWNSAKFVVTR
jgi:hypothetical protein